MNSHFVALIFNGLILERGMSSTRRCLCQTRNRPIVLAEKWEAEHKRTTEPAFNKVAGEGQKSAGPSFYKTAETDKA